MAEQTDVMDQCDILDRLVNKSLSPATAEIKTEGVCVTSQGQCDTKEAPPARRIDEIVTEEEADKQHVQCDAQEKIKSGDDMGGASRLPKGQCRVVAHELASSNKCAAVQTRAIEREGI